MFSFSFHFGSVDILMKLWSLYTVIGEKQYMFIVFSKTVL